jgi:hypothetical protein
MTTCQLPRISYCIIASVVIQSTPMRMRRTGSDFFRSAATWLLVAAIGALVLATRPSHGAGLCSIGIADYTCTTLTYPAASSMDAPFSDDTVASARIRGFWDGTAFSPSCVLSLWRPQALPCGC